LLFVGSDRGKVQPSWQRPFGYRSRSTLPGANDDPDGSVITGTIGNGILPPPALPEILLAMSNRLDPPNPLVNNGIGQVPHSASALGSS